MLCLLIKLYIIITSCVSENEVNEKVEILFFVQ